MKKTLSVLLAFCVTIMIFTAMPVPVQAYFSYTFGDYEIRTQAGSFYRTSDSDYVHTGNTLLYRYNGDAEELEIPYEIGGYKIDSISPEAFKNNKKLKRVTINNYIAVIGNNAFENCTSLESVTITDGDNPFSDTFLMKEAFKGCTSLKEFNADYSLIGIGTSAFEGCSSLESLDTLSMTRYIGESAFKGCTSLKSIFIPDTVKNIYKDAFFGCTGLTDIHIENLKAWCEINFENESSNPLAPKLTSKLFLKENLITDLVIPDGIETIKESAFINCAGIKSVTFPDTLKTIENDAFSLCLDLKRVNVNSLDTWCGIEFMNRYANPMSNNGDLYVNGSPLKQAVIPDTVTQINKFAFYNCSQLESVTFPDSIKYVWNGAFSHCTALKTVDLGESSIYTIFDEAFEGCESLESVYLSNTIKNITTNAFYQCYYIEKVYYSGDEEEWEHINIKDGNNNLLSADKYFLYRTRNDEETGVIVKGNIGNTTLSVIADNAVSEQHPVELDNGYQIIAEYQINLLKNNVSTDPKDMLTILIPVATEDNTVMLITDDSQVYRMDAVTREGYVIFDSDRLGIFAVLVPKEEHPTPTESPTEVPTEKPTQKPTNTVLRGDVDGDGTVTILDATAIQRTIAELPTQKYVKEAADADADGSVTIMDATAIQRYIAELPTNPGIGTDIILLS